MLRSIRSKTTSKESVRRLGASKTSRVKRVGINDGEFDLAPVVASLERPVRQRQNG